LIEALFGANREDYLAIVPKEEEAQLIAISAGSPKTGHKKQLSKGTLNDSQNAPREETFNAL
jgi:hypothetical protein